MQAHACSALSIEYVAADPGRPSALSLPGHFDAGAVVKERAASWIWRWINQQIRGNGARHYPTVSITRPVALAITPPRKLARWLFAALIDDGAGRMGEMPTPRAIEYRPADCDHTEATLPPRFPIQCKSETVMFRFQVFGLTVARE